MDEEYKMGDAVLGRTTQEKDLGVTSNTDMKVSEQCGIAASKGNQILGLIRRTITYKEKHLIVPLYKAIVRPHLEYCIQAWRPYRKKDIDKLERIQRRATKMIPELRDLVMGRRGHKYRNCRGMAINMLVQRLCREEEVGFVDLWGSFVGRADMYMKDGLHLSGKGAAVFADKLSAAVDSDLGIMTNIFGSKHSLN